MYQIIFYIAGTIILNGAFYFTFSPLMAFPYFQENLFVYYLITYITPQAIVLLVTFLYPVYSNFLKRLSSNSKNK